MRTSTCGGVGSFFLESVQIRKGCLRRTDGGGGGGGQVKNGLPLRPSPSQVMYNVSQPCRKENVLLK